MGGGVELRFIAFLLHLGLVLAGPAGRGIRLGLLLLLFSARRSGPQARAAISSKSHQGVDSRDALDRGGAQQIKRWEQSVEGERSECQRQAAASRQDVG